MTLIVLVTAHCRTLLAVAYMKACHGQNIRLLSTMVLNTQRVKVALHLGAGLQILDLRPLLEATKCGANSQTVAFGKASCLPVDLLGQLPSRGHDDRDRALTRL